VRAGGEAGDLRRLTVDRRRLRLDGWLAVAGWLLVGGRLCEQLVEAAGEVALEGAQRAFGGLALGLLARQILPGGRVALGAGDGNDVQRVVELPVAARG
jgi:hypothetical protein